MATMTRREAAAVRVLRGVHACSTVETQCRMNELLRGGTGSRDPSSGGEAAGR